MSIFALQHIEQIKGKIRFFKLLVDGRSEFDEFEETIKQEGNLAKELITIQARMREIADLKSLPEEKFKKLKGCNDAFTEYEIKTRNLRVYLFKEEKTGNIIVCGGKKGSQKEDIKHFRNLKRKYIQTL